MMSRPTKRPKQGREQVYLLRLWQVESDGHLVWRASLEDAHTGERQGFADLALLYAHLAEQTTTDPSKPAVTV